MYTEKTERQVTPETGCLQRGVDEFRAKWLHTFSLPKTMPEALEWGMSSLRGEKTGCLHRPEIAAWLAERLPPEGYDRLMEFVGINDDRVAFEFKVRWL